MPGIPAQMILILMFTTMIFLYSLLSRRSAQTVLTSPIVFTTAGIFTSLLFSETNHAIPNLEVFLWMAQIGLVLLLFTDASRTDLELLKNIRSLPMRLLSVGMLLTILFGALFARLVFPGISIWEAGIIGAILAPTDAGLGQIIVNDSRVPEKIRQALNVEAGLNDGLSVPFLLFFIALAAGSGATEVRLSTYLVEQLIYGTLIGAGVGAAGGFLLDAALRKQLIAGSWEQLGVITLPFLSMLLSEEAHASMFIAAFVAGLAVQLRFRRAGAHCSEFAEENGQLLNLAVFFLLGIIVARDWQQIQASHVIYAFFSLTVIRMAPVAIALIGTGLDRATVIFMGWFGPRGLASIVLGLVYLRQLHQPEEESIRLTVMTTVLLSIYLHGASAAAGIKAYSAAVARSACPPSEEETHVVERGKNSWHP